MPAATEFTPGLFYIDLDETDLDTNAEIEISGLPRLVRLVRAKLLRQAGTSPTIQPLLARAAAATSGDAQVEAEAAAATTRWDEITDSNPITMVLAANSLFLQPQFTDGADNHLVGQLIFRRLDAPRHG